MGQIPGPVIIIVIVFVFIFAKMALRIIRPFEKGLVEFLGKFNRTVDSGLAFVIPVFETIRKVDMREQVLDVPPQDVITKDNVSVTVDAVIYFKITDPFKVVYNVANFIQAAIKLAQTNLRNVVGDMALDETLTSREKKNTQLRLVLD
jgi:regulator of protease activity HflC (stomatin/prohibitin superfamily)